jgi:glutaredoxin 3
MKFCVALVICVCAFWCVEVQARKLVPRTHRSRQFNLTIFRPKVSYEEYVDAQIAKSRVVIFSKSYCPFSQLAKEQFQKLNYPYHHVELDYRSDGEQIQDVLGRMTGARTMPRVFISGVFIGGGEDMENMYANGSLKRLLDSKP